MMTLKQLLLFFLLFQGFQTVVYSEAEGTTVFLNSDVEIEFLKRSLDVIIVEDENIIYEDSLQHKGLSVSYHLETTDYEWLYKLSIVLNYDQDDSIHEHSITCNGSVLLKLGPIPHEKFEKHFGPSSAHNKETGVAALTNNKAVSYSLESLSGDSVIWSDKNLQWAGIHDRYFALMVLPYNTRSNDTLPFSHVYFHKAFEKSAKSIESDYLSFKLPLSSGDSTGKIHWDFYIFSGPKLKSALTSGPIDLKSLLFVGQWEWMRQLSFGLFALLKGIYFVIPSWGLSIILLALVIRIFLYPLARKALKSQQKFIAAQKLMQPEMKEIKANFKGGEQSERILELYKKYNVSPFAGLKPLMIVLLQLPILIALFSVLGSAFELRNASFLWIETLAEPDSLFSFGMNIPFLGSYFNLLPFLMALVTLVSLKLSPAPSTDKKDAGTQNLFLIAMTLMFFFLFYSFPAGLVLYWTFANVFHLLQQKLMLKVG